MADTTTPVYSFVLPEIDGSDGTWGTKLNANLTALDGLLSGSANLQNASFTGTASFGGSTGTSGQVLKSQGAGANAIWTDDSNTTYTAGSGLSLTGTEFANTAPDQTVVMNAGSGISVSGTYPTFTVTNSSPDQTVGLTGTGGTTISGTYPNFTINSTDNNTTYTAGTGLTLTSTEFSVTDNGIGALQLNVSGNGTSGQFLASDGDGTFSWQTGGAGGNETLAQTLALGAVTGGTDISVSSGDNIVMAANSTVDGRDVSVDGAKLDLINQGVATTDSPAFAGGTFTGALNITPTSGYANIELGGVDGAFIDLKAPNSDDYDMRMITSGGSGGTIDVGAAGDLALRAGGSERARLLATGRVGIGEAAPATPLHVKSADNAVVLVESTDTKATTAFKDDTTTNNFGVAIGCIGDDLILQAGTTSSVDMTIKADGKVGIGQAAPSSLLHLGDAGAVNPQLFIETTDGAGTPLGVTLGVSNTTGDVHLQNVSPSPNPKLNISSATTTFQRSGAEKMRIDNTGVGIGTTSPSEDLHVAGQCLVEDSQQYGSAVSRINLTGGSYGVGLYVNNTSLGGTGTTALFQTTSTAKNVVFSNGGTTSIFATFNKYNSSAAGHIRMTNQVLQYQVLSDARAKENIVDAGDAGSKIDAIQVRQFDWIEGGLHEEFGFIAQELAPIVPLAVGGEPDGEEMMGVDASKLVPLLVKEIQSLRARVAALEE